MALTDPSARGAGNTFGSTSGTAPDPSNNYGAPAGANAVTPTTNLSFAQQGYSGVGTPLGVPYGTTPQAPPQNTAPHSTGPDDPPPWTTGTGTTPPMSTPELAPWAPRTTTPSIDPGVRMMDTGPLFGSEIATAKQAPGTTSSGPWTPSEGYTGLPGFNPTPTSIPTTTDGQDPFILRDQMYGLNPTPVDNVSNALMRRYRSYYR